MSGGTERVCGPSGNWSGGEITCQCELNESRCRHFLQHIRFWCAMFQLKSEACLKNGPASAWGTK